MTTNHYQNMYTGPGVTAPIRVASHASATLLHPEIYYPSTPNTSMNIVKRSEIVARPAKGTNNLESINNNQGSNQVYLDNKEKNQNKCITSNDFNRQKVAIDHLWERTKEEYDEEVATEIDEAMEVIMRAFNLPDGVVNVRRSKKYKEVLEALHYGTGEIIKIIEPVIASVTSVASSIPSIIASVPILDSTTRAPIIQPTEQGMGWVVGCPGDYDRRMTQRAITRQEHYSELVSP